MIDMKGLRKLQADTPVKVKAWMQNGVDKKVLHETLGDLLDQFESRPAHITLELSSSSVSLHLNYEKLQMPGNPVQELWNPTPEICFDPANLGAG